MPHLMEKGEEEEYVSTMRFLFAMATDVNHFCEDSRRYSFVTNLRSLKHKKSGLCIVVVPYSTIAFFS